jgi:hypothetical protein
VIVVSRFQVAADSGFAERARAALDAFAACAGFERGRLGRAADDPALWTIVTEWKSVGAFRRALSAYDVKLYASPLLAEALPEPGAYEVLLSLKADGEGGIAVDEAASELAADAGSVRVGEASGPRARVRE